MSALFWLTVTFSVTFITLQSTIYVEAEEQSVSHQDYHRTEVNDDAQPINVNADDGRSAERSSKFLGPLGGILVGEETPVWEAYPNRYHDGVFYVESKENGVRKAIDYWRSNRREGPHVGEDQSNGIQSETNSTSSFSTIPFDDPGNLRYLSILVVMDYAPSRPIGAHEIDDMVKQRVSYALSFWEDLQLYLPHFGSLKVQLSVSGIVVALDRGAVPYVYSAKGPFGLQMAKAHSSMLQYWWNRAHDNTNFPINGYHIVVTMTNSEAPVFGSHAKSSFGTPCDPQRTNIGGIVFHDDLAFGGINVALREIGHVLGAVKRSEASNGCPSGKGFVMTHNVDLIGKKWSPCSLREISEHLQSHGWCMAEPRQFRPHGAQIETVLPGVLMSAVEQCEARGWKRVCPEKSTCGALTCRKWYLPCTDTGFAEDGTPCGSEKICFDGRCVNRGSA